jgi:methionyl-tRNA formyltransferase
VAKFQRSKYLRILHILKTFVNMGNFGFTWYSRVMNFVFFGTDEFSVKALEILKQRGLVPTLVVTVPDKPKGRKMVLTPPMAKVWAKENNIPIAQPDKLKDFVLPDDFDFGVVASYGKIIPDHILNAPKQDFLNIHPSLLPKYRGATPLESAILSDDIETGVTIMQVDMEMDHGPIVAQTTIPLAEKWYGDLRDESAEMGANLLVDILPDYLSGKISPAEQNHDKATVTKKITKADGLIDLSADPILNFRKIRAFTPWPGSYFFHEKDDKKIRVVIKKAHLENNVLILDSIIPEGKNEMSWTDFNRS